MINIHIQHIEFSFLNYSFFLPQSSSSGQFEPNYNHMFCHLMRRNIEFWWNVAYNNYSYSSFCFDIFRSRILFSTEFLLRIIIEWSLTVNWSQSENMSDGRVNQKAVNIFFVLFQQPFCSTIQFTSRLYHPLFKFSAYAYVTQIHLVREYLFS